MTRTELKELCEKATKGPWICDDSECDDIVIWSSENENHLVINLGYKCVPVGYIDQRGMNDGHFIAAAREWLPKLLEENDKLHQDLNVEERCWTKYQELKEENEKLRAMLRRCVIGD